MQRFAKANNRDIILFFIQHFRTKKDDGQIVDNTKLLTVQDADGSCIGSDLLYYYRRIPVCLLTNLSIELGMVNKAQTTVYEFIPNLEGNCKLFRFEFVTELATIFYKT